MAIPTLDEALRMTKGQFAEAGGPNEILQIGPELLTEAFDMPAIPEDVGIIDESIINTYVINTSDLSVQSLGDDDAQDRYWIPHVDRLASLVLDRLAAAKIGIAATAFATVSVTPSTDVNDDPHFDDGIFDPAAGVGAVAVVGSGAGPRVATAPLSSDSLRPGTLVEVSEMQKKFFKDQADGRADVSEGCVALFPQFAQLHSGPGPTMAEANRRLMVLRVETVPTMG